MRELSRRLTVVLLASSFLFYSLPDCSLSAAHTTHFPSFGSPILPLFNLFYILPIPTNFLFPLFFPFSFTPSSLQSLQLTLCFFVSHKSLASSFSSSLFLFVSLSTHFIYFPSFFILLSAILLFHLQLLQSSTSFLHCSPHLCHLLQIEKRGGR